MLNPYFLNSQKSEQNLLQSLINEQLKMYGIEIYYIPRRYVTKNTVIREVIQSEFDNAYPLEAYLDSYEGYGGQGTLLSKFGIENQDDLNLTKKMIYNLTKNGIDEIAIFIISPIPGSEIFDSMSGYSNFSELNFSPIWRKDYSYLFKKRLQFYMMFLSLKIIFFPIKIIKQIWNFLTLNFQTKMEMVPYKYLKLSILTFRL